MKVFFGSDHRGHKLKEKALKWVLEKDYQAEDMGAFEYDENDDYTLYAEKVAVMVRDEKGSRGILFCGSGVGVDVTANKFDGIRASIGKAPEQVRAGRKDDDMNILVIAADYTKEKDMIDMMRVFLRTKFDKKARHKRRLEEIEKIEANN